MSAGCPFLLVWWCAAGKYDPKHPPPPPDPERWIPKSQRSYNRRGQGSELNSPTQLPSKWCLSWPLSGRWRWLVAGRKGRTKFTGAQGSGDGAQVGGGAGGPVVEHVVIPLRERRQELVCLASVG